MTHATTFPRLFSPFSLRAFVLKNRIVSTSHDAHFGMNGLPTDRYIRYHVEKAKGGTAVVQAFGITSVAVHALTGERATFEAESVVVASGGRANDSLFDTLRGRIDALFVVGDAVAPRRVHDAVLEGTRVGRQV